jgi:hypothetical protein
VHEVQRTQPVPARASGGYHRCQNRNPFLRFPPAPLKHPAHPQEGPAGNHRQQHRQQEQPDAGLWLGDKIQQQDKITDKPTASRYFPMLDFVFVSMNPPGRPSVRFVGIGALPVRACPRHEYRGSGHDNSPDYSQYVALSIDFMSKTRRRVSGVIAT